MIIMLLGINHMIIHIGIIICMRVLYQLWFMSSSREPFKRTRTRNAAFTGNDLYASLKDLARVKDARVDWEIKGCGMNRRNQGPDNEGLEKYNKADVQAGSNALIILRQCRHSMC